MKKALIIFAMVAAAATLNAQPQNKWEGTPGNDHKVSARLNEFDNMEMSVNDRVITFSAMPEVKKMVYAVITNADGEQIKQQKINQAENSIDIHRLHSGLYFVSIVYRNTGKKTFTLNL